MFFGRKRLKQRRHYLKTSLSRYALSYTAFLIFLLLVMGIFMYSNFSKTAKNQYVKNGYDMVEAVAQAHTVQWNMMRNTVDQLMTSADYAPFKLENDPLDAVGLINRLREFSAISKYYETILFAYGVDDYVYTNTTSSSIERTIHKGLLYETIDPIQVFSLLRETKKTHILPLQYIRGTLVSDGKYMSYVFPLSNHKNAVVLFLVRQDKLKEHLNIKKNDLLWLYDTNGTCLYGSESIPFSVIDKAVKDKDSRLNYKGVDYMCFEHKDPKRGITYYLYQPSSILTDAMRTSARTVLIFAFALTIPAMLIITLFSIRFGRKIRRIRQIVAPQEGIDSFDSIESAAKQLVLRTKRLDSVLDENALMQRNALVRRLVQNGAQDFSTLEEEGKAVGIDLSGGFFVVILVGLRPDRPEYFLQNLNQIMLNRGWGVELVLNKQALLLLCASSLEMMEEDVRRLEIEIRNLQSNSVIAVSGYHEDSTQIPLAFLEAQSAYDMRFLVDTDSLLRFDKTLLANGLDYPRQYIDALKNAIRTKDQDQANHSLAELLRYAKGKNLSMPGFRLMYNDIIQTLLMECSEKEFQENATQMYSVFSLSQYLSIADLNGVLNDLCMKLIKRENLEISVSSQMREIAAYIQSNYQDPNISMGEIARKHEISAVAFSLCFKEEMGMSPSNYLTMTRMEEAKQLLIQTNATVREIGLSVGYYDAPGFLRKFKAYTSMTPTQYRSEMREKSISQQGENE
jgi:AraC-like DNA-binding protein